MFHFMVQMLEHGHNVAASGAHAAALALNAGPARSRKGFPVRSI
ncbi:hypothetical protein [Cohnella sp. LGH]|nr:hypothetical protein [Cohnella sp. LGH]